MQVIKDTIIQEIENLYGFYTPSVTSLNSIKSIDINTLDEDHGFVKFKSYQSSKLIYYINRMKKEINHLLIVNSGVIVGYVPLDSKVNLDDTEELYFHFILEDSYIRVIYHINLVNEYEEHTNNESESSNAIGDINHRQFYLNKTKLGYNNVPNQLFGIYTLNDTCERISNYLKNRNKLMIKKSYKDFNQIDNNDSSLKLYDRLTYSGTSSDDRIENDSFKLQTSLSRYMNECYFNDICKDNDYKNIINSINTYIKDSNNNSIKVDINTFIKYTYIGFNQIDGMNLYTIYPITTEVVSINNVTKTIVKEYILVYKGFNNCNRSYIYHIWDMYGFYLDNLTRIQKPILVNYYSTMYLCFDNVINKIVSEYNDTDYKLYEDTTTGRKCYIYDQLIYLDNSNRFISVMKDDNDNYVWDKNYIYKFIEASDQLMQGIKIDRYDTTKDSSTYFKYNRKYSNKIKLINFNEVPIYRNDVNQTSVTPEEYDFEKIHPNVLNKGLNVLLNNDYNSDQSNLSKFDYYNYDWDKEFIKSNYKFDLKNMNNSINNLSFSYSHLYRFCILDNIDPENIFLYDNFIAVKSGNTVDIYPYSIKNFNTSTNKDIHFSNKIRIRSVKSIQSCCNGYLVEYMSGRVELRSLTMETSVNIGTNSNTVKYLSYRGLILKLTAGSFNISVQYMVDEFNGGGTFK